MFLQCTVSDTSQVLRPVAARTRRFSRYSALLNFRPHRSARGSTGSERGHSSIQDRLRQIRIRRERRPHSGSPAHGDGSAHDSLRGPRCPPPHAPHATPYLDWGSALGSRRTPGRSLASFDTLRNPRAWPYENSVLVAVWPPQARTARLRGSGAEVVGALLDPSTSSGSSRANARNDVARRLAPEGIK